jgi:hypothetical protein
MKSCQACGGQMVVNSTGRPRVYCSPTCRPSSQPLTRECDVCGETYSYNRKARNPQFCRPCMYKVRRVPLPKGVRSDALQCGKCQDWKSDEMFREASRNRSRRGRDSWCRVCRNDYQREWQRVESSYYERQEARAEIIDASFDRHLRNRYGITEADYYKKLAEQDGKCAICHSSDPVRHRLHVDHDHDSGQVRSLLCFRCNIQLGFLEDREWVQKAQAYLKYWKGL